MLIATTLAAAFLASTSGAAAPPITSLPPMVITVSSANDVSSSLVSRLLAEADTIWRNTGFTFVWQRERTPMNEEPAKPAVRRCSPQAVCPERVEGRAVRSPLPSALRVVIGKETGTSRDTLLPLGWIVFEDVTPDPQIYVSYANAQRLLEDSPGIVGVVNQMPRAERETYLARGMGRALAHELGHYLLASKAHTRQGLMRATWSAAESFSADRARFVIDPAQRQRLVARLRDDPRVESRPSPAAGRGGGV